MGKRIERFEDLIAWQKARVLTKDVYLMCLAGKFASDSVLSRQMRSAVVNLVDNAIKYSGPNEPVIYPVPTNAAATVWP